MTGKQAILDYLKTHKNFCAPDVSAASGATMTSINQAANIMFHAGVIVPDGRVWRTVYYRYSTEAEREGLVSTNGIFQECKNSAAMQRVLAFYGRAAI